MGKSAGTISGVPPRLVASPTASYVSDGTPTGSQAGAGRDACVSRWPNLPRTSLKTRIKNGNEARHSADSCR